MKMPRTEQNGPTILDVARAAGVSRATAARALGGYGQVSAPVLDRVQAAADALGYRPNSLARRMRASRTRTLGVVVADIGGPFFAQAVRGVTDVVQALGYEVLLANSDADVAKERSAVRVLFEDRVDGLIVAPASPDEGAHIAEIQHLGVPVVLIDRGVRGVESDTVVVDNLKASLSAVSHLAALGHRDIAIVAESTPPAGSMFTTEPTGGENPILPSAARVAGYLQALEAGGLAVRPELIRICRSNRENAVRQVLGLLALRRPPTAIFATDSMFMLGAVEALREVGRSIPEDMSLVGFDDPDWATIFPSPLTVISQPVYEIGATAGRRMVARLAGDDRPLETQILATTFLERASTAPLADVVAVSGRRPKKA